MVFAGSAPLRGAHLCDPRRAPRSGALPAMSMSGPGGPRSGKTSLEADGGAVAAALRGAEIGAAVGEAPDDLAGAEVEARPFGGRELVAPRPEAFGRRRRHMLLGPHRLVDLVHAPPRPGDCGLRIPA